MNIPTAHIKSDVLYAVVHQQFGADKNTYCVKYIANSMRELQVYNVFVPTDTKRMMCER